MTSRVTTTGLQNFTTQPGGISPPPPPALPVIPSVSQIRTPFNSNVNFLNTPFVPLTHVAVNIQAVGDVLLATGQCVFSGRTDPTQGYPGYNDEYSSSAALWMTATSLISVSAVTLSQGVFIDVQDAALSWYVASGGGNTNPYARHSKSGVYVATAADVGVRYVALLGWVQSNTAGPSDYILSEATELSLDVLNWTSL